MPGGRPDDPGRRAGEAVRRGDADVAAGYAIAELLHADPDPVVHKPVGICLAYAGERLPDSLTAFLDQYGNAMPRPAFRLATRLVNRKGR